MLACAMLGMGGWPLGAAAAGGLEAVAAAGGAGAAKLGVGGAAAVLPAPAVAQRGEDAHSKGTLPPLKKQACSSRPWPGAPGWGKEGWKGFSRKELPAAPRCAGQRRPAATHQRCSPEWEAADLCSTLGPSHPV